VGVGKYIFSNPLKMLILYLKTVFVFDSISSPLPMHQKSKDVRIEEYSSTIKNLGEKLDDDYYFIILSHSVHKLNLTILGTILYVILYLSRSAP